MIEEPELPIHVWGYPWSAPRPSREIPTLPAAKRNAIEDDSRRRMIEGAARGGRTRHRDRPAPFVGQIFGEWTVTRLLGRGVQGRRDMRLQLVNAKGRLREVFEFQAYVYARKLAAKRAERERKRP